MRNKLWLSPSGISKKHSIIFTALLFWLLNFAACGKEKTPTRSITPKVLNTQVNTQNNINLLSDEEILTYANSIIDGADCHIAKDLGEWKMQFLQTSQTATFTLVLSNIEAATQAVATGKQRFMASSNVNGPYNISLINVPICTNDTIGKALLRHEQRHIKQGIDNGNVAESELEAYTAEHEFLLEILGESYKKFLNKAISVYNTSGIGKNLFDTVSELFPNSPKLETNLINPALMFIVAIKAGKDTPDKFASTMADMETFLSSLNGVTYSSH